MNNSFSIKSDFIPAGDQPNAISGLVLGLGRGLKHQTLLGVTGSGKTFTIANVVAAFQKPTLVIAHNKTLAAQLAQEYREFFPNSAVHYFVSYYDYYQPEAYMPITDTYIEKDAQINEEIDRLRHASTQALLTQRDVIIVASVSCIYGLGSPEDYENENLKIKVGDLVTRQDLFKKLVSIHFERTNSDLTPGSFRSLGNNVEIMPTGEKVLLNISLEISADNRSYVSNILKLDPISMSVLDKPDFFFLFPAKHFLTNSSKKRAAIKSIRAELAARLRELKKSGKILEAERLKRRTSYDLAMINEVGYCSGIENYSRHLSMRPQGSPPDTLLSYFPHKADGSPDFLTIIDESHVTVPQIGGMYSGDQSRKKTLIEHGFRLLSALDNRPLKFGEFSERVGQVIYTSATPGDYELGLSKPPKGQTVEQIIRPTGLVDPEVIIKPIVPKDGYQGQIKDFIDEVNNTIKKGFRVIATTLTKKMAEELSIYLKERGVNAEYLHSDIKTIERITILSDFRKGKFDCIVGVNLLREGLDLPEVALIGILDADKEGFLRSETALIQTIGRAARNIYGRVILYADHITGSMRSAIDETNRRRKIQADYNTKHNITPKTIIKSIKDITENIESKHSKTVRALIEIDKFVYAKNPKALIKEKERQMNDAVKVLDFETAAILRDEIKELTKLDNSGSL
ncbi:MAG: excinuclease ABC subunit UvrB [Candidatus Vogelbacteria bacterium]|nr:excinuclease ABC subunit UvrB [Candidatus Vogelbacteria bacterium]